jgi:hypothetical protein
VPFLLAKIYFDKGAVLSYNNTMTTTKQLHKLYQNRELLVFINGQEWFNEQVNALHKKQADFNQEVIVEAAIFELENGY